ncbi:MAG TPA: FAD-dependent oxidoreductase [Candidatus Pacearchaeota archaeon]|nr:FAD-dependent oxidoreductase [Candidatus Pacearchaeota archaeon]
MISDLVIIGGGPAGITAAIYASRNNIKTMLFSQNIGGMLFNKAVDVQNYTGFPSITGFELAEKFKEHLEAQDKVCVKEEEVINIKKENNIFKLNTLQGEYFSRAVIIASGSKPRELNIKGEKEFLGKGVSYCPICDGPFLKNKDIAIIGGGNAAFESAIFLSNIANKIFILERGDRALADQKNQEKVNSFKNIQVFTNAQILEIKGNDFVNAIKWMHNNELIETEFKGVFIQAGYIPETDYLKKLVDLNDKKEIIVNSDMETRTKGLFAAGDITNTKVKQIICAASSGAIAALSAYNYLLNYEQN